MSEALSFLLFWKSEVYMAEIKNYQSNSIKSRENAAKKDKPEITAVVDDGDAKIVGTSLPRKIFNSFFPEATNKPVGSFMLFDMFIPALKSFVGTVLISGGKNISNSYGGEIFGSGKKSYENYYNGGRVAYMNNAQKKSKIYDCEHVWYSSLPKAQGVIDKMNTILQQYPVVSVADMKELSKLDSDITPGDHHIGWSDIQDVKWYSDHGGYTVVFPPTIQL